MKRKLSIQNSDDIKNDDLVWVFYRKKPWPVKVKRVYLKKITYNFLPIQNHPKVFSAELKNVKIFKETDKVPPNGTQDQCDAYDIAMKMLKGEYTGEEELANGNLEIDAEESDSDVEDADAEEQGNEVVSDSEGVTAKDDAEEIVEKRKKTAAKLPSSNSAASTSAQNDSDSKKSGKSKTLTTTKKTAQKKETKKSPVKSKVSARNALNSATEESGAEQTDEKTKKRKKAKSTKKQFESDESTASSDENASDSNFSESETKTRKKTKKIVKKNGAEGIAPTKPKKTKIVTFGGGLENETNNERKEKFSFEQFVKENPKRTFKPGDIIIVNTDLGMWPGTVTQILNNKEVNYKIFPLEASPEEMNIDVQYLVPFPERYLDKLMIENAKSTSLLNALKSVKSYLRTLDGDDNDDLKAVDNTTKKSKKEKVVKNSKDAAKKMDDEDGIDGADELLEKQFTAMTQKTKNDTQTSEKKSERLAKSKAKKIPSIEDSPSDNGVIESEAQNDFLEPADEGSNEKSEASLTHNSTLKRERSEPNILPPAKRQRKDLSASDEEEEEEAVIPSKRTNARREAVTKTLTKKLTKKEGAKSLKKEALKKENEDDLNSVSTSNSKVSFNALVVSDAAKDHMNAIWTKGIKSKRNSSYAIPKQLNDLKIEFLCGELLTLEEVDKAVSEIHKWIALCTRIPPMTPLFEHHYVANVVLPEACVFSLSQMENCSLEKAESKFQALLAQEKQRRENDTLTTDSLNLDKIVSNTADDSLKNSVNGNGNGNQKRVSQKSTDAFQDLLLAATIMQDKEKKNGNGNA